MGKKPSMTIICGHYGSGKTNLALNMAFDRAETGKAITLVDLDIVNPYFRSSEYRNLLTDKGIKLVAPTYANTSYDVPSLPAAINSVFEDEDVIFDVGGDDVGATALGRFRQQLMAAGYEMFYVVNRYRNLTATSTEAAALLREIEAAARLRATAVVNNSHLQGETTVDTIRQAYPYGREVAERLQLPLAFTTAPSACSAALGDIERLYPVTIYVRPPWEETEA